MAERLLCKERVRSSSLLVSTTCSASAVTEDLGSTRDTIDRRQARPARASIAPLISAPPGRCRRVTDQRIAGRRSTLASNPSRGPTPVGPHLNNWIVFGRNEESSISPSSQGNDPDRSHPVTDHLVRGWRGSSYKGHGVDALAPRADEGRGRLRKASGSREQTVIRRCPNGETRLG